MLTEGCKVMVADAGSTSKMANSEREPKRSGGISFLRFSVILGNKL